MALHRQYSIRFTEKESIELDYLLHKYNFRKASSFIKKCIFQKELKVITYDESLYDITDKLNEILFQYRKIGANYNQVVKQINKAFSTALFLQNLLRMKDGHEWRVDKDSDEGLSEWSPIYLGRRGDYRYSQSQ
jgi:hypothetical protein